MHKFLKGFVYAYQGIQAALQSELNLKVHLCVMIAVIIAGFLFHISATEWMICCLCFALVISSELINTAIEATVDLVTQDKKPLAKKAKDVAAGAVLVNAIFSAIIGLIIFGPKLFS